MDIPKITSWKKETIWTWALLIALTLLSPILGKFAVGGAILLVALLKFFTILFSFMELRNAHRFWVVIPLGIATICVTFVGILLGK